MKTTTLLFFLSILFSSVSAQIVLEPPPEPDPEVDCHCMGNCYVQFAEEMPYFFDSSTVDKPYLEAKIAGDRALIKFIKREMQYPAAALLMGLEGTIYIRFGINAKGNIDKKAVKVLRGVHPILDKEALRVVDLLAAQKWVAAKAHRYCPETEDKSINAYFTFPFRFKLP